MYLGTVKLRLCVVVVCEEALSYSRAADGHDACLAGLFGSTTPATPTLGTPQRDRTESNQPTDQAAHLTMGFSTARRDSPGPCDGARSGL